MLKANKKIPIEDTVGTGLPTLLANNLKVSKIDLPEKGKRRDGDIEALPKIRKVLGPGKIMVIPKHDGTVEIRTSGGVIILTP